MDAWKTDAGLIVAERFEIECLIHQNRWGKLFRARDQRTGKTAALKLLRVAGGAAEAMERHGQEMQRCAGLHLPGIAPYMAHGQLAPREFFVATEWIEGEDLGQRLGRQPLRLAESLILARSVATTLTSLHAHGFIHGELKPSRLLLRGGAIDDVVLLGLGRSHDYLSVRTVTQSDEIVATLRYVAPEVVRGHDPQGQPDHLGPQADIYALGCVLFQCLTGAPPLTGEHAGNVLAQLLYGEAPSLTHVRKDLADLCPALDTLLGHMLAPSVAERMAHGGELLTALAALAPPPALGETTPSVLAPPLLTGEEQHLVSLVLGLPPVAGETAPAHAPAFGEAQWIELRRPLAALGARIDALANGSLLVTLMADAAARQTATDQAVQAARAAQVLQERLPAWRVSLATGQGANTAPRSLGKALHQATVLLDEAAAAGTVWLDELTAELLDTRFQVHVAAPGHWALGPERRGPEETRLLLGRPTPCVGREQELRLLSSVVSGAIEEAQARVVLVLGPSGIGKSRLRHEFVKRLRGERPEVKVVLARGDALHAGTPNALLAQTILGLCGLPAAGHLAERQGLLEEHVRQRVPPEDADRVTEFLGELCGLPFSDDTRPRLRAARQEPRLMNDQATAAFLAVLGAECATQPIVLVFEDLHWSDEATVRRLEAALKHLAEQPLVLLALARPEAKERFPRLWQACPMQELHLAGLGRKASEQLVRTVLGEKIQTDIVTRIVDQAGGHALFLEELIRAVAEGNKELPETVLAMLRVRLLRLGGRARRTLAAAGIFGDRFWRGGLVELLSSTGQGDQELDRSLEQLVAEETIVRRRESRFAGEVEYGFRHALVREAAYSLLDEDDRRAGHRAVAEYLERIGERESLVLAEHHQRGGQLERAAQLFARAAVEANAASDRAGALHCVEQGLRCQASGETLGTLYAAAAYTHFWAFDFQQASDMAHRALPLLVAGSEAWCRAIGVAIGITSVFGQGEVLVQLAHVLATTPPAPGAEGVFLEQLLYAVTTTCVMTLRAETEPLLRQIYEVAARLGENDMRARGLAHLSDSVYNLMLAGDHWQYQQAAEAAIACFRAAGDRRFEATAMGHAGIAQMLLGNATVALSQLRATVEVCEKLGESMLTNFYEAFVALTLVALGAPEQLEEAEALALDIAGRPAVGMGTSLVADTLAGLRAARGEFDTAEQAARQALAAFPVVFPPATATLGRILAAQGKMEEARTVLTEGLARLARQGGTGFQDIKLHLSAAELWRALGEEPTARQVLARAAELIAERASRIPDADARARYLGQVRENVAVLTLHRPG